MQFEIGEILEILEELSPRVRALDTIAPAPTPGTLTNVNRVKRKFHQLAYDVLGDTIPAPPPGSQPLTSPPRPTQRSRTQPDDEVPLVDEEEETEAQPAQNVHHNPAQVSVFISI